LIPSPEESTTSNPLELRIQDNQEMPTSRKGLKHKHLASLVNEQIAAMKLPQHNGSNNSSRAKAGNLSVDSLREYVRPL
jgi:hypothetical protein